MPIQIRFNDLDALGHVNNSVYFSYADMGKFRYMEHVLGPLNPGTVQAVIVNVGCDFFEPTKLDEQIEILTAVKSIGPKSLHVEQRVVSTTTGDTKCLIRTVLAGWDPQTGLSAPIAKEWIEKMEAYEQRKLTDF